MVLPTGDRPLVLLYSGQGAQYYGMGRELMEGEPAFSRALTECSERLAPRLGRKLLDVLYDPGRRRAEPFTDTLYTHPALFAFQWSLTQALRGRGIEPDLLLGYSIGELVAATVAGALGLQEALDVVVEQARLTERRCPPGAMAAVLAAPAAIRERFPAELAACHVAAVNGPAHFVVAGLPAAVERLCAALTAAEVVCQTLPVRFAFHTALVDAVEGDVKAMAAAAAGRPYGLPVVSCARADFVDGLDADYLWDIVRRPVRFDRALALLESRGPHVYVDAGPSGTLANLVKYALPASSRSTVAPSLTPFGGERRALDRLQLAVRRRRGGDGPPR
jgi:acyl transferase domain-containing protein